LIMGYAVCSKPGIVIAIVTSVIWFLGGAGFGGQVCWYYPFAAAALFLPYCCWRKSEFAFTAALLAIGIAVVVCSAGRNRGDLIGSAFVVLGLLYTCWGLIACSGRFTSLGPPAVFLGFLSTTIAVYLAGFQGIAEEWLYAADVPGRIGFTEGAPLLAALLIGIVLMVPAALRVRSRPGAVKILGAVIAAFGLFVIGSFTASQLVFAVLANIALFVLAATLVGAARDLEDRRLFWSGVVLVALVVVSRTLEYETGLLIKALVFTVGGIAVIASGVMFERFLRTRRIAHE